MEIKETFCLFCSLGCKFAVKVDRGSALSPEFCPDYPVNEGRLCPRGLCAVEILNHPRRLITPYLRENGKCQEASWGKSLSTLASKINEVRSKYGSQSIGIIIEPNHTNEELFAAQELARIIGTDNFACSFTPNDWGILRVPGIIFSGKVEDLENANCSLIIGDLFAKHPVLAKRVIDAKYKARGNIVIVVDSQGTSTTRFANTHLQNRPGSDALVLVGLLKSIPSFSPEKGRDIREKIEVISDEAISKAVGLTTRQMAEVARTFNEAEKGIVVLCPSLRGIRDVNLLAWLCRLLVSNAEGNKQFMPLFTSGNAVGAFNISFKNGWKSLPRLIEGASSGDIKLLIDFGEDLLSSYPSAKVQGALKQLEFFALSSLFRPDSEDLAQLILPCASPLEKKGRVNFFDGRMESLEPILMPPGTAKSELEMILRLSQELGKPLDEGKIESEVLSRMSLSEEEFDIDGLVERIDELIEKATAPDKEYPYLLITSESTGHFADGSITRNLSWVEENFPPLFIKLNPGDAGELGVKDGDEVVISSRNGEIALPVQLTVGLCQGIVSVPSYSSKIRSIFSWHTTEGELETGPERVRILRK